MVVRQHAGTFGLNSLEDIVTVPVADLAAATQVRAGGGGRGGG
jgi:hypothetical protein